MQFEMEKWMFNISRFYISKENDVDSVVQLNKLSL